MITMHIFRRSHFQATIVLATFLLGACANPHFSATHEQVEQRIANAHTRADHQGLAQFFEQEAKEAKNRADKHRAMAKSYALDKLGRGKAVIQARDHCETMVSLYEKAEQENKILAALHQQLAAETSE